MFTLHVLSQTLQSFILLVVDQLVVNLKRLHGMGMKKVAVTSLEPLGCLPQTTVSSSFQECNGTQNTAVTFHNLLLSQAVTKLNNETKDSPFVILDLYASFMSVFENKADHLGICLYTFFFSPFFVPKFSATWCSSSFIFSIQGVPSSRIHWSHVAWV